MTIVCQSWVRCVTCWWLREHHWSLTSTTLATRYWPSSPTCMLETNFEMALEQVSRLRSSICQYQMANSYAALMGKSHFAAFFASSARLGEAHLIVHVSDLAELAGANRFPWATAEAHLLYEQVLGRMADDAFCVTAQPEAQKDKFPSAEKRPRPDVQHPIKRCFSGGCNRAWLINGMPQSKWWKEPASLVDWPANWDAEVRATPLHDRPAAMFRLKWLTSKKFPFLVAVLLAGRHPCRSNMTSSKSCGKRVFWVGRGLSVQGREEGEASTGKSLAKRLSDWWPKDECRSPTLVFNRSHIWSGGHDEPGILQAQLYSQSCLTERAAGTLQVMLLWTVWWMVSWLLLASTNRSSALS